MEKIVVSTKFNKTGKRVLSVPLGEEKVCAPAYRQYKEAYRTAQDEWKCKCDSAIRRYVEKMAHWIASYVAKDSTAETGKYKIAKFLAKQSLVERGPMNTTGPGSSQRWSIQLSGIPELSTVEEEAWEAYAIEVDNADTERNRAIAKARTDCNDMKRELIQEVSDHMHYRGHQEDDD